MCKKWEQNGYKYFENIWQNKDTKQHALSIFEGRQGEKKNLSGPR